MMMLMMKGVHVNARFGLGLRQYSGGWGLLSTFWQALQSLTDTSRMHTMG